MVEFLIYAALVYVVLVLLVALNGPAVDPLRWERRYVDVRDDSPDSVDDGVQPIQPGWW